MNVALIKLKEVLSTVLPITAIVLVLSLTLAPLDPVLLAQFLIGALLIIVGLTIFLFGVDIGITPLGQFVGTSLAKRNNIWVLLVAGLALGFLISVAEPDLHVLAGQVEAVTESLISKLSVVVIVSIGIALLVATGLARIVYSIPLYKLLTGLYALIFIMAIFVSPEFFAISFDASAAVTGVLVVPFMLALALGVSRLKKDSRASEEDSFGLVGMAAVGAIMSVMLVSVFSETDRIAGNLELTGSPTPSILSRFVATLPAIAGEIALALLPMVLVLCVFQKTSNGLSRKAFGHILMGVLLTFIGVVLFLTGVNAGFMDVGSVVGYTIASIDNKAYLVIIGFVLGCVIVLAEPAVHVLTRQIEDVTSGYVSGKAVLISLCLGVGLAVALSMLRILVSEIELWHYLLPGYLVCIALAHFAPKLFVGIGFDGGCVASGPMTATFILAFAHGAAQATEHANVLVDGFGMLATVTMMPIIALQALGILYKIRSTKVSVEAPNGYGAQVLPRVDNP